MNEYQLVAEDGIEMRGSELKRLAHFSMVALPVDSLFYLLGPKELIEACPCSPDDRITWLMENQLYNDAMEFAMRNQEQLKEWSLREVGRRLISHLIDVKGDFVRAASWLPVICGRNAAEWDSYFGESSTLRFTTITILIAPRCLREPQPSPETHSRPADTGASSRARALRVHSDSSPLRKNEALPCTRHAMEL